MENHEKNELFFSEGEQELFEEKKKISALNLFKKTTVVILKSLKFKNVKNKKIKS